jgi:hypothetical protein
LHATNPVPAQVVAFSPLVSAFSLSAFQRFASCLLLAGGDFDQAPDEM